MVIVDKRAEEATHFKDLCVGDAFFCGGEPYIKTSLEEETRNAFRLHYNTEIESNIRISPKAYVRKVELEIIIHEEGWSRDCLGEEFSRKE